MATNLVGKIVSLATLVVSIGGAGCGDVASGSQASDEVGEDVAALRNDDGDIDQEDAKAERELQQHRRPKLQPQLNCVDKLSNGDLRAHWGYRNSSGEAVQRKIGSRNTFTPRPADRGQPTKFLPGTHSEVFTTTFSSQRTLYWTLEGNIASAAPSSRRCSQGAGGAAGGAAQGGAGAGGAGRGGAGGAGSGGAGGSNLPGGTAACTSCRQTKCTNYQGLGVNVVEGCFTKIDPQFGAQATDPTFIQDCISLVSCAYDKKCGFDVALGSSQCYCGTASLDTCYSNPTAPNGPCIPQFQQAARSTLQTDISVRVSDLSYPLGWANYLLECDTNLCGPSCKPQ